MTRGRAEASAAGWGKKTAGASLPRAPGAGRLFAAFVSLTRKRPVFHFRRAAGSRLPSLVEAEVASAPPLAGAAPPVGPLAVRTLPDRPGSLAPVRRRSKAEAPIPPHALSPGAGPSTLDAAFGPRGGHRCHGSSYRRELKRSRMTSRRPPASGASPSADSRPHRLRKPTRAGFSYGIAMRTSQEHYEEGFEILGWTGSSPVAKPQA
jgi:hypothetical protein